LLRVVFPRAVGLREMIIVQLLTQLLYNSNNFFFEIIIESVLLQVGRAFTAASLKGICSLSFRENFKKVTKT
jgi:hypothetical protein